MGRGEGAGPLETERDRVVVGRAEPEVLEVDDGEGAVGGPHQVVGVEVAVGRDGVADEGGVRRVAGEPAGELVPEGGSIAGSGVVAVPLERPAPGMGELGGEEGGVEGRVQERGAAGRCGGAARGAPPPRRGGGRVPAAPASRISAARSRSPRSSTSAAPDGRVVVEEQRDADAGRGEGGADLRPARLRRGGGGGVEDEDERGPASRRDPEVAPLSDVAREREGRPGRGEPEIASARPRAARSLLRGRDSVTPCRGPARRARS